MMRSFMLLASVFLAPLCLAGCGDHSYSSFGAPYSWHKTGVSDANLAAMVANPADLQHGRGSASADEEDSPLATTAVTNLWAGKAKPLPAVDSETAPTPGSTNSGSGGSSPGSSSGGS